MIEILKAIIKKRQLAMKLVLISVVYLLIFIQIAQYFGIFLML